MMDYMLQVLQSTYFEKGGSAHQYGSSLRKRSIFYFEVNLTSNHKIISNVFLFNRNNRNLYQSLQVTLEGASQEGQAEYRWTASEKEARQFHGTPPAK